jgi:hypothetical protein
MSGVARHLSVGIALLSFSGIVSARDAAGETETRAAGTSTPWRTLWSADTPSIGAAVRAGHPFVVRVVVPLCSNEQIDCGSGVAGRAGDPDTNLYWGAAFGMRRHFDRLTHVWELVQAERPDASPVVARRVYRRWGRGEPWGATGKVEQLVVLEAMHGDAIYDAAAGFWTLAAGGGHVEFDDGGQLRREAVHVAGYAGHNALAPGHRRAGAALSAVESAPIPSFALGCQTERIAAGHLRNLGSAPLVTTRQNMAPEGYVVEAVVRALGDNATKSLLRARVVASYARFQRIPTSQASSVFSR